MAVPPGVVTPKAGTVRRKRSKPNWRLVKVNRNYSVDDAARVTGASTLTIRRWIKTGALPAIIDRRPHLILGGDLADYLRQRNAKGPKLEPDQFYCFGCHARRRPALGMTDYLPQTATAGNLTALCEECSTVMNKVISRADMTAISSILNITIKQGRGHLIDTSTSSLNDQLDQGPKHDA